MRWIIVDLLAQVQAYLRTTPGGKGEVTKSQRNALAARFHVGFFQGPVIKEPLALLSIGVAEQFFKLGTIKVAISDGHHIVVAPGVLDIDTDRHPGNHQRDPLPGMREIEMQACLRKVTGQYRLAVLAALKTQFVRLATQLRRQDTALQCPRTKVSTLVRCVAKPLVALLLFASKPMVEALDLLGLERISASY